MFVNCAGTRRKPVGKRLGTDLGTDHALHRYAPDAKQRQEIVMTFGKGALLWLVGVPLPIILLLALFWR